LFHRDSMHRWQQSTFHWAASYGLKPHQTCPTQSCPLPPSSCRAVPCSALVSGQAAARASTSLSQLCLYNFLDSSSTGAGPGGQRGGTAGGSSYIPPSRCVLLLLLLVLLLVVVRATLSSVKHCRCWFFGDNNTPPSSHTHIPIPQFLHSNPPQPRHPRQA